MQALPDTFDPLFLLLGRRGGDAVHSVVALHHAPVRLRLAGLDDLVLAVRDIQLEAVLEQSGRLSDAEHAGVTSPQPPRGPATGRTCSRGREQLA